MLCPVCKAKCKSYRDMMEHIELEYGDECPNGCYGFTYTTGYYQEWIGRKVWQWSYFDFSPQPSIRSLKFWTFIARIRYFFKRKKVK